jgi:PAS domain S-box-containing protein
MGDQRFARPYEQVRGADDRAAALRHLSDAEVIEALAHASRESDALLANVLATEATNRMEQARAVHENVADGLCSVDVQGRILSVNPAAERMLRWPRNELVGKDQHDTIHARDERGRPMPKETCRMLGVLRTGEATASELDVLTRKDGTTFPVSFTASPIQVEGEVRGMVIAFRDITARKTFEVERAAWLNLVDAVYHVHDELGIGTLIVDDGRIHYANDAFRTLFGYSLEHLKAEVADVFALFPAADRDAFKAHLADLYIHGTTTRARRARLLRRDGSTVDAEIWVAKVNHQPGKVSRLVFVVRPM